METVRVCAGCGSSLAAEALQGMCPACLMKAGLQTGPVPPVARGFVAPPASDLAPHFAQLEILELLGQGGMGAVYKARQRGLDRVVALKILPPMESRGEAFAERFSREARSLARLNHPSIVTVHDFGQAGPYYYLVMEFVDGATLRQLIRDRHLRPTEALGIVPQICEALQYAHDEGVVHRDIKPENILLDRKGRVKIADFGLAKLLGQTAADWPMVSDAQVMGTPHYMAPEQFEKPLEVDHRADIYALGVVFYEMLTGEVPMGRFAAPSEKVQIDVRLDDVVLRSLEREPARRYQRVSEVKSQVEDITGVIANLPPGLRRAMGFEYRSKATLFGLPLVHIATGPHPVTGRRRVATGIIAIGDIARGVIASGGVAMGVIAFGGVVVGLVPIGGLAVGVAAVGGMALGFIFGYGGVAIAPIAVGGLAVGVYAMGGAAYGLHAMGGNGQDAAARDFFRGWNFNRLFPLMLALCMAAPILGAVLQLFIRRAQMKSSR
jgi:predicted Ser/Thr protein kinase